MVRGVAIPGVAMAVVVGMLVVAAPAYAYWNSTGSGVASAQTGTLAPPTQVVAAASGTDAAVVTWTASSGPVTASGYFVERFGTDGVQPACGSSATALLTSSACTDSSVAPGDYSYRVTAAYRSWTALSASSAPITISASPLGAAGPFSVLGSAVTTTGFTRVSGDLGSTPGAAIVGFPDGIVSGVIHAGDPAAAAAGLALVSTYGVLAARTADQQIVGDLIGRTFGPGVYHAGAALALTGALTLNGGGDPNAVFIFQADAAVNTAAASHMVLTGGAKASNVYWVVNAAVGTGADSAFAGTILAQGAITLGARSQLIGRALSRDAVTMADNVVRFTTELPPTLTVTGGSGQVTKDTTPTITGITTATAGRTVTVTIASQTLIATVQPDHSWSVTATALTAGFYSIVARVRDTAGNGGMAAQTLVVEVNPPILALGSAAPFSILVGTTVVVTGASSAQGDVGVSPGTSITGLPPTAVGGTIHAGDPTAADALSALSAAIAEGSGRAAHTQFAGDTIGRTFHAGVHQTNAAFALSGTMTLDGEGDSTAVFIFQIDAAMNTAAGTSVLLVNGAQASNVFWVVHGAVNTGALATLPGTVLATGTITLGEGTLLTGRALTLDGVVMAGARVTP